MLAACTHALADYPNIVRDILGIEPQYTLICGMSLGYADPEAAVNRYRTEREELSEFVRWCL